MMTEKKQFNKPPPSQIFYLRILFIGAAVLCMALGLASRRFDEILPSFVSQHGGDAIWAMMIYFGFRFLLVKKSVSTALGMAILFCFSIEVSQLYQGDWINEVRNTVLGSLVLGHGFLTVDLFRYAVGIAVGALLEKIVLSRITR
ncbi:DUF2809 domain-containing protein [Planococcus chinensis]|uniref:ribosomal maturation YjgA family protein n=1 Tax=Planococcus chinensis TaxID=272917 RepID=UPI001CC3F970|nr:DUF2809 domain-containing protein [Planococcus chinensis]